MYGAKYHENDSYINKSTYFDKARYEQEFPSQSSQGGKVEGNPDYYLKCNPITEDQSQ